MAESVINSEAFDGDEQLALLLARGVSVRKAAEATGTSQRTIRRRLADGEFFRRMQEIRATLVSEALGHLASASAEAARTLRKLLKDESSTVRLSAAKSILETGDRLRQAVEVERRLAEIEAKVGGPTT